MKKRILVLGILLVALLFAFAPSAHAGVGFGWERTYYEGV